jgi:hypothetical protein
MSIPSCPAVTTPIPNLPAVRQASANLILTPLSQLPSINDFLQPPVNTPDAQTARAIYERIVNNMRQDIGEATPSDAPSHPPECVDAPPPPRRRNKLSSMFDVMRQCIEEEETPFDEPPTPPRPRNRRPRIFAAQCKLPCNYHAVLTCSQQCINHLQTIKEVRVAVGISKSDLGKEIAYYYSDTEETIAVFDQNDDDILHSVLCMKAGFSFCHWLSTDEGRYYDDNFKNTLKDHDRIEKRFHRAFHSELPQTAASLSRHMHAELNKLSTALTNSGVWNLPPSDVPYASYAAVLHMFRVKHTALSTPHANMIKIMAA